MHRLQTGRFERGRKTNRQHIRNVKAAHDNKVKSGNCPRCGGKLTLRTAKKGSNTGNRFWGCTGFPGCRFTKNV
ncbi:MAG: hypothetical protein GY814_05945 [Gammaproteobacteria bacterium]|nr:hypothetical protein [Gammaproteobacteria bacterium]